MDSPFPQSDKQGLHNYYTLLIWLRQTCTQLKFQVLFYNRAIYVLNCSPLSEECDVTRYVVFPILYSVLVSNLIFVVSPSIGGKRLLSMESLSDTRKVSVHENSVCTPCLKMPVFLMLVFVFVKIFFQIYYIDRVSILNTISIYLL